MYRMSEAPSESEPHSVVARGEHRRELRRALAPAAESVPVGEDRERRRRHAERRRDADEDVGQQLPVVGIVVSADRILLPGRREIGVVAG